MKDKVAKTSLSVPTMCLHCHLVVTMELGESAWMCPKCGHEYPVTHWKIRKLRESSTRKPTYVD